VSQVSGNVPRRMFSTPRRFLFSVAALAVIAAACATAQGFELQRVQRKDVEVLPGNNGFVHPLSGIVSYTPQDWQSRPLLAIKVGNSANERPQAGLDRADVVYEELVEGGVTRFMAIFSTNQAPRVGPVRSVRTVDPVILQPLHALFGYSGGVPPVVSALRGTPDVTDVGANSSAGSAYYRDSNRSMPYNLYTSTDKLWQGRTGEAPDAQFDFLAPSDDASLGGTENATDLKLSFASDSSQLQYKYNETTGLYERFSGGSAHMVEGPSGPIQLTFRNILVQFVSVSVGSTVDRAGLRTRDIQLTGSGDAVLIRGGRAIRGTWSRSGASSRTTFTSSSGPMRLAPGETMVELLPQGRNLDIS
jgi:hypothetical protein